MINTNWTQPKRNMIAALNDLRKALASGRNAKLIRINNEDCAHPIKVKNSITDFRAYEFTNGLLRTRDGIRDDDRTEPFQKHLSLNYKNCYGTQNAVDRYYKTGLLSSDNFKGVGRSHLVKVEDLVRFHACLPEQKDKDYAEMFRSQYFDDATGKQTHFYDFYRLKPEHSIYTISRFKRKVWAIQLLKADDKQPRIPVLVHVLNALAYPLKFIPNRSVLKMNEYKCVTFRIGAVTNGYELSIQIPKKFGFK